MEERVLEVGGRHNQSDRSNIHSTHWEKNQSHEVDDFRVPWDKIKEDGENKKEEKGKP
jgi:hypothetical protein